MLFCIPKQFIDVLTTSALKSEVDLEKLYLMDSKTRREFFTSYTNKETGKFLNTKFEQAMVSKQQGAMLDWAKSTFTPTEKKKPEYKTILDKINQLSDLGYLNDRAEDVFLEDLVSDKLGVTLTGAEMENITRLAGKVEEAQQVLGANVGNPEFTKENIVFFSALKDINDYIQSATPSNVWAIGISTIGRGVKLLSLKSPVLNIGSNAILGVTEGITRRMSNGSVKGADNKLALDYMKLAREVYKKTGYDISRMESIKDVGASGERVIGDTVHSQGAGKVRAVGRVVENIVFKQLMGAPDAAFASAHFADTVNLLARNVAKGDKNLARELMVDAMRVTPTSDAGALLRQQAIMDAEYATWTNDTWASSITVGFRKLVNDLNPDWRIGDYLFPFVKTPANVVANSLDFAGVGAIKGVVSLVQMARTGNLGDKAMQRKVVRDISRAGLGVLAAAALAAGMDDDDYVGAYDPYRYQLDQLRNAPQNSFRIGDTWVSTDWLGPISVPFNAIMHARKYGKAGPAETVGQYFKGSADSVKNLPVIEDFYTLWDSVTKQNQTAGEMATEFGDSLVTQVSGMIIPSILTDVAKSFDSSERKTSTPVEAIMAKIPGVRNTLPEKENVFGESMPTENIFSTLLFGSRVKTSQEDSVIAEVTEVVRLSGKNIQFTDWQKSNSKKLAQFREKVGESKYKDARVYYGDTMRDLIRKTVRTSEYKNADIEKKNDILSGLDTEAQEKVFSKFNFTYKQDKKK